ncbi:MAG TPA: Xaa-Pro peptidase family protein [Thermomicrobiales bacterium]|mgnify:CR=1 FL=1|nr:Xaa-Pro peptidase family protein [Thermomicrobiales bacterium]
MTTADVYRNRLEHAQQAMATAGVDVMLIGPSSDLRYLTGIDAHISERLNLLVLPRQGKGTFVVPNLEALNFQDKADLVEIVGWGETEQPAAIVGKLITTTKVRAIGDQLHAVFLLRFQEAAPGGSWVPAGPILKDLRMHKDAAELAAQREVAKRTDEAWAAFLESGPISGLTERQVMDRLSQLMVERGMKSEFGICASGPHSAMPHYHTGERVIGQGDAVLFDWGGELNGYLSDMTRTVFIGTPSEEQRKVYEIVLRANQAAFEAVRPGVPCEAIDAAARAVITEAGYGDAFIHRVGHGLGMDVHEDPYLVLGNTMPLAEGMVFSDEPGIYLAGMFGVRIEDTVACTADGAVRINNAPKDLTIMD